MSHDGIEQIDERIHVARQCICSQRHTCCPCVAGDSFQRNAVANVIDERLGDEVGPERAVVLHGVDGRGCDALSPTTRALKALAEERAYEVNRGDLFEHLAQEPLFECHLDAASFAGALVLGDAEVLGHALQVRRIRATSVLVTILVVAALALVVLRIALLLGRPVVVGGAPVEAGQRELQAAQRLVLSLASLARAQPFEQVVLRLPERGEKTEEPVDERRDRARGDHAFDERADRRDILRVERWLLDRGAPLGCGTLRHRPWETRGATGKFQTPSILCAGDRTRRCPTRASSSGRQIEAAEQGEQLVILDLECVASKAMGLKVPFSSLFNVRA